MEQDKPYRYWMHNLPGIGDRTIEKLLLAFGSERAVFEADEKKLQKVLDKNKIASVLDSVSSWDLMGEYESLVERKIRFFTEKDPEYPDRLRKLKYPPYGIYCIGNLPGEEKASAAIIGARECSEYGSYVAGAFAGALARAQVSVISGMARGIDGIAQQGAVNEGGATFAVLGCGVDICYPASNRPLYEEILRTGGGVLSPFVPGTTPQKRNFPERNRIVAGLSDVLLVVEARQKSGTWITVDMALEQGKNVYAVPGRLTDRLSDGCNLLIRQGAGIALSPEDLLRELEVLGNRKQMQAPEASALAKGRPTEEVGASALAKGQPMEEAEGVLAVLDFQPRTADELLERMRQRGKGTELSEVLMELMELCMKGRARQEAGHYVKTAP